VGGTCEGLVGVGGGGVEVVGDRCRANEREEEERRPQLKIELQRLDFQLGAAGGGGMELWRS
jgi:hypothetical protein